MCLAIGKLAVRMLSRFSRIVNLKISSIFDLETCRISNIFVLHKLASGRSVDSTKATTKLVPNYQMYQINQLLYEIKALN